MIRGSCTSIRGMLVALSPRRRKPMTLLSDCSSCGALSPQRTVCPHCGVAPQRTSLKRIFLALGLGMASVTLMACYGMPPCDPKTFSNPGFSCVCDSSGICAPQCNPATFAVDGGKSCFCQSGRCVVQCDPATFVPLPATSMQGAISCVCSPDGTCTEASPQTGDGGPDGGHADGGDGG